MTVIAACGGDGGDTTTTAGSTDTTGAGPSTTASPAGYCDGGGEGNLIWAHEQEPPDMHLDDPANNLSIASWIRESMLESLYGISAATTYIPELLAEDAVMTDNGDGTFTANYKLREGLMWSDGDDLTADDVKFLQDVIMATVPDANPDDNIDEADPDNEERTDDTPDFDYVYLIGDRTGYDTVTDFTVTSPTEFSVTWSAFFAGWKGLYSQLYPSHPFDADPAVAAAELNDALREWTLASGEPVPTSGPMAWGSWEKTVSMSLVRNDNYHGSNPTNTDVVNKGLACVAGLDINFVADTDAQVNAMKAGEAHIIYAQPQQAFLELAEDDAFTVASTAGPVFEHWGLNILNVHLAKPEVREAIALAFNKQQVVETLYTPLFGDLLPVEGLGNTYWMSNQPQYEDHQGDAGYGKGDIDGAKAKLEAAGYVLGDDGIYEHPTDGRLTLRNGTTGGNKLRELQQELIQANLKQAGIEIVIENLPGGEYFNVPFGGDPTIWEITQFAWVGGPWPGGQSFSYRSGSGNNPYGFASANFDARADECDATVDQAEQDACYSELDTYTTTLGPDGDGLFMIPITQKPSFFAYSNVALEKGAVAPDANQAGPVVNIMDYKLNAG
jgi:peptide/nickel transport system substrate-binding protein